MEKLHHIEFAVSRGDLFSKRLISQFGFHLTATRSSASQKQWVVQSGKACILISEFSRREIEKTGELTKNPVKDPYFVPQNGDGIFACDLETVFNVAVKVKDIKSVVASAVAGGAIVLKESSVIKDDKGAVELAVIRSCIGNVVHTLVDDSQYHGNFLPLFEDTCSSIDNSNSRKSLIRHIDHVAFVCARGSTSSILSWYENCLQMQRFFINSDENTEDGFVIQDTDVGLRMKAMEYWHCSETGLRSSNTDAESDSIKFVLVESLNGQGLNQVDVFLEDHGGPGVQHVGLYTDDIVSAVSILTERGTDFVNTPAAYYTGVGKLDEIEEVGYDVELLRRTGILLDTEADPGQHCGSQTGGTDNQRYLMQKFTKPLFSKRTFFLELIQRVGARGFGAGNISALWRAVQAYMIQDSKT